jgi:hypothetical protein
MHSVPKSLDCRLPRRHEVTIPSYVSGVLYPNWMAEFLLLVDKSRMTLPERVEARRSVGASHTFATLRGPAGVPFRVHLLVGMSIVDRCDEEVVVIICRICVFCRSRVQQTPNSKAILWGGQKHSDENPHDVTAVLRGEGPSD